MAFYIKPEYFQTIHYYFFCLGIFSLTTSFMFTSYNAYSYIFMSFYVVNSAISWYMSWFMHTRMKTVFVVRTASYLLTHVVLTFFSGGLAVLLYYMFQLEYEALITGFIMVNFFVIFFGLMWYILHVLKVTDRFFDWQERGKLEIGRDMVIRFREKKGVKLIDDKTLKGYKWGTDAAIDGLFMQVKMKAEKGEDFSDIVRDIEMKLSEAKVRDIEMKIENLGKKEMSETDRHMLASYNTLIKGHEKDMLEYEKALYRKKLKKG
jgi:hypothetical protein